MNKNGDRGRKVGWSGGAAVIGRERECVTAASADGGKNDRLSPGTKHLQVANLSRALQTNIVASASRRISSDPFVRLARL